VERINDKGGGRDSKKGSLSAVGHRIIIAAYTSTVPKLWASLPS
jgi:hypothetical protein